MGSGENIWASLVGLPAFADWTLSRFTVRRRVGLANVVSGRGILAPSFSTVSFDGFQQELICPTTPSRTIVCLHESCTAAIAVRFVDQCVRKSRRFHSGSNKSLVCWDQSRVLDTIFHPQSHSQSTPRFASLTFDLCECIRRTKWQL